MQRCVHIVRMCSFTCCSLRHVVTLGNPHAVAGLRCSAAFRAHRVHVYYAELRFMLNCDSLVVSPLLAAAGPRAMLSLVLSR